jgi:chromosome segregation protein
MEAARRRQERLTRDAKEQPRVRIAHEALSGFMGAIEDAAAAICDTMEIGKIHDVARQLGDGARERREEWLGSNKSNDEEIELIEEEIRMLKAEQSKWEDKRVSIEQDEAHLGEKVLEIQGRIDEARAGLVEDERHLLEYRAEGERIAGQLQGILSQERQYLLENEDYARELNEIEHMLGAHALNEAYVELDTSEVLQEERRVQLDRRRELERVKIRLEDIGGTATNADTLKEFEEEQARDNFLAHEIEDLTASATSLRVLIDDLRKKLDTEFIGGIEKINAKFQQFFEVMFGGGSAALDVVEERVRGRRKNVEDTETIPDEIGDDDEETTTGIDIAVSLPRKKVRGLMMLSGGERALTSIALLFAMSQVNPPPFMILDETDAALDESNSRKYGDMLKNLSEVSQLIVVTHNRETMSRAGILYGVTMAADAVSQVLSVKFDEALKVAK